MLILPERLDAVRRTGLLDTGPEEPFDRLTRLACELLGTPFGFVTVVDERRSFWKSCTGITSTEVADRQNPVGESFCQYIIATDAPVIIDDARLDPMTRDNPSITSMGVIAWAGFPGAVPGRAGARLVLRRGQPAAGLAAAGSADPRGPGARGER